MNIVYFSSVSENTRRLVSSLGFPAERIPLYMREDPLRVHEPYVLITPTYGGGHARGAVPKQVIRFLNNEDNRALIRGVIAAGNTNFGAGYCLAGDIIAHKCEVPMLGRVEIFGTPDDHERLRAAIDALSQHPRT